MIAPATITLRGMTWDHPRGHAPLAGAAAEYAALRPGVSITWDRRSLRAFGEAPIEQYADAYDLIVIDHPFVGFAARHPVLAGLSAALDPAGQAAFAADSVGPSWPSYWYEGELWALPLDAAAQVASHRPDLLAALGAEPPRSFEAVIALGGRARAAGRWIAVPACSTDAICLLLTIAAGMGHAVAADSEPFLPAPLGRAVIERLRALIAVAHPRSLAMNPIAAYDAMAAGDEIVYVPYAFGYTNYARPEARRRLAFCDIPGVAGSILGGTGIAVSACSRHRAEAIAYARWLADPHHQAGAYVRLGGQPASAAAWRDPAVDRACGGFFSGTIATLTQSYLRPRFDGFIPFFERAGEDINACLAGDLAVDALLARLNEGFDRWRRSGTVC